MLCRLLALDRGDVGGDDDEASVAAVSVAVQPPRVSSDLVRAMTPKLIVIPSFSTKSSVECSAMTRRGLWMTTLISFSRDGGGGGVVVDADGADCESAGEAFSLAAGEAAEAAPPAAAPSNNADRSSAYVPSHDSSPIDGCVAAARSCSSLCLIGERTHKHPTTAQRPRRSSFVTFTK